MQTLQSWSEFWTKEDEGLCPSSLAAERYSCLPSLKVSLSGGISVPQFGCFLPMWAVLEFIMHQLYMNVAVIHSDDMTGPAPASLQQHSGLSGVQISNGIVQFAWCAINRGLTFHTYTGVKEELQPQWNKHILSLVELKRSETDLFIQWSICKDCSAEIIDALHTLQRHFISGGWVGMSGLGGLDQDLNFSRTASQAEWPECFCKVDEDYLMFCCSSDIVP